MKIFWTIVAVVELAIILGWPVRYIVTADNDNAKGMGAFLLWLALIGFSFLDLLIFGVIILVKK